MIFCFLFFVIFTGLLLPWFNDCYADVVADLVSQRLQTLEVILSHLADLDSPDVFPPEASAEILIHE